MDHFAVVDHFPWLLLLDLDWRFVISCFNSASSISIDLGFFLLGLGDVIFSFAQTLLGLFVEARPIDAELSLDLHSIDCRYGKEVVLAELAFRRVDEPLLDGKALKVEKVRSLMLLRPHHQRHKAPIIRTVPGIGVKCLLLHEGLFIALEQHVLIEGLAEGVDVVLEVMAWHNDLIVLELDHQFGRHVLHRPRHVLRAVGVELDRKAEVSHLVLQLVVCIFD